MRTVLMSLVFFVTLTGTAPAGGADACLRCHDPSNEMRLMGKGVETLTEKMEAIRAGDVRHPPGLSGLSDDDIAKLAATLDAGP